MTYNQTTQTASLMIHPSCGASYISYGVTTNLSYYNDNVLHTEGEYNGELFSVSYILPFSITTLNNAMVCLDISKIYETMQKNIKSKFDQTVLLHQNE